MRFGICVMANVDEIGFFNHAEMLGYDSVWVSDHVVVPNANVANFGEAVFDPFVTLAVAAGATRRVALGTTVLIVPYRDAVVTAKMVSSLDALSGGRVILGIGAGWVAAESAMLGVPSVVLFTAERIAWRPWAEHVEPQVVSMPALREADVQRAVDSLHAAL